MKPCIIKDNVGDIPAYSYAIYVGKNLSDEYPNSYHFYIWVSGLKIWERHAYRKDVWRDVEEIDGYDMEKFIKYIFIAKEWIISS